MNKIKVVLEIMAGQPVTSLSLYRVARIQGAITIESGHGDTLRVGDRISERSAQTLTSRYEVQTKSVRGR